VSERELRAALPVYWFFELALAEIRSGLSGQVSQASATVSDVSMSGCSTLARSPQCGSPLSTVIESTVAVPTELMSTTAP
jgi:hypothetical protein